MSSTYSSDDFRKIRFRTPEDIDHRWLDWYREEFSRSMFGIEVVPSPDQTLWIDASMRVLPEFSFYAGSASPMRSSVAPRAVSGAIGITIALGGTMSVEVDGEAVELPPGAALFGTATTLETSTQSSLYSVALSPRLLAPLVPNLSALTQVLLPAVAPALRLLIGYLRLLEIDDAVASPAARHVITSHVHDLVGLALGATGERAGLATGSARAARLAAIKHDIHAHSDDPRLSIATLAARHGVTPRYIHKLFETEGVSFTEYVLSRRLRRAHDMLADPRLVAMPIGAIAYAVGFGDLSYFNRCFRRRFGCAPRDLR